MLWFGRPNRYGSLLPDDKKAYMWHSRRNNCDQWSPGFPQLTHDSEGDDEDKRKSNEIIEEKLSNTKS